MAIKCELANDAERGPGYGLIRIWGLSADTESLEYCLERNQGSLPYLATGGNWQAQEVWHRIPVDADAEPPGLVAVHVGPEVVDPLVEQPQNVVCRLTVRCGSEKHPAALKIRRPLLSSKAHAPPPSVPLTVEPEPVPPPLPLEGTLALMPEPAPAPAVLSEDSGKAWRIAAWSSIPVLLTAAGVWLWWDCRIPAFPGPRCGASQEPAVKAAPPADALPRNCSGLDAEACLAAALKGLEAGQLDRARQLLQEAGNLGAVKAHIHLARMYDPDTWAADKSPAERADWETASYWYDEAARAGDREGMLGAGRLYCRNSGDAAFRAHGVDLLRKAVAASPGEPGAEQLLKECEEKLK